MTGRLQMENLEFRNQPKNEVQKQNAPVVKRKQEQKN